jgi:hypothetical protein
MVPQGRSLPVYLERDRQRANSVFIARAKGTTLGVFGITEVCLKAKPCSGMPALRGLLYLYSGLFYRKVSFCTNMYLGHANVTRSLHVGSRSLLLVY